MPQFQNIVYFVTGATGLVGSTIIKKLLEAEFVKIITLVRKTSDKTKIKWLEENDVQVIYGDLLDIDSFKKYLGTADVVVHAAAAVQIKDKKINWDVNVQGTINIVETMLEFNVKRIIHISTVGVYGKSSKFKILEEEVNKPIGEYSKSKYQAEIEILKHKDKLNITIFRPPYIVGSIEQDRHVIPTLYKLLSKRILPRILRKNPKFGFVHARDIASATLLTGSLQETPSLIYNIQSFTLSYNQAIEFGELIFDRKIITIPIPFSILQMIAPLLDFSYRLLGKKYQLRRRINKFNRDWTYSTDLIEKDLNWISQYDNNKIFVLLSNYYDFKNNLEDDLVITSKILI